MNRKLIRTLLLGATLLATAACGGDDDPSGPNTQTGTVSGRVTDDGGDGVASAVVALSGRGTQTTNATGNYTFTGVPTGTYTLTITIPTGFEAVGTTTQSVTVAAGGTATGNFSLRATGGGPQVTQVNLVGTTFSPASVTIQTGETVRWVNQAIVHNITPENPSQAGVWDAEDMAANETFEHTFGTAGTYDYTCTLHAGMDGTVVVE